MSASSQQKPLKSQFRPGEEVEPEFPRVEDVRPRRGRGCGNKHGVSTRRSRVTELWHVNAVAAHDVGGRSAVEGANQAAAVRRDDAAPAPAGADGTDELERQREAQEHQLENRTRKF
jgi:hypothetical protein